MGKPVKEAFLNSYLDYLQENEEIDECLECEFKEDEDLDEQVGKFLKTFGKSAAMVAPGIAVGQLTGNPLAGVATSIGTGAAVSSYQQAKAEKAREAAQKERDKQIATARAARGG